MMRWKLLQYTAVTAALVAAVVMAPVAASAAVPPLVPGQISDLVTVAIDGTKAGPSHAAALARAAGGTLVKVTGAGTPTPVAVVRVPEGESARAAVRLERDDTVAFIQKPITAQVLLTKIHETLERTVS